MHKPVAQPLAQHSWRRITMDIKSLKPTIVLVHGAVEDSSLWTHGVIQRLQREGYRFKVFSNPLRGLFVDAAYPRRSAGTNATAAPVAVGANVAAPTPANTRLAMAMAKVGASAVMRLATTKMPRAVS